MKVYEKCLLDPPIYIVPATSAVDIHHSVVRELSETTKGLQCTYANILTFSKIKVDSFHDIMEDYKIWWFILFPMTYVTNVIYKRHKWWYILNIYRHVQTNACTSHTFLTCYPFKFNYTSHSRTNTSCALRSFVPIWTHLITMPTSRLCEYGRAESERDLNCTKSVASKYSYILSV